MADTPKTPKAPKAKADRPPSARRLAAAEAYNKQFGRAPRKSMTISAMEDKVASVARQRAYQESKMKIVRDSGLGGFGPYKGDKSTAAPVTIDPVKIADARLQTAKAQAQVAVSTGSKSWANAATHNANEATRRIDSVMPRPTAVTNDMHMGTASHAPAPSGTGRMARAGEFLANNAGRINVGLGLTAAGVSAARAYSQAKSEGKGTGDAVVAAAKSGVPTAAVALGGVSGPAAIRVGSNMMNTGKEMFKAGSHLSVFNLALDFPLATAGAGVWSGGAALKTMGHVVKTGAKVLVPAIAAVQAVEGYQRDGVFGAVKGAATAFDPTEIARVAGAKQGVVGWGFDKAREWAGGKSQAALPAPKQQAFAKANADFNHDMSGHASQAEPSGAGKRGWANPANQAAAQEARGVKNVTDWARR